ncbi:sugar phosphate isomerase/epimerase [Candidatus Pacearchaeota archaeon]|nr:sugar phosphate isomerase/epimerase [Candidatus Pacearchaeota archaeon]
MGKGDYHISDIYQGGYSSLKPSYGDVFTGYRINAGSLGLTTDPRNANVLQEASSKLATGVKQIEISAVQPEVFESIPKQQLKELNRLSKLTGVDISVHGPIIEASGLTKDGFTESNRRSAERQMSSAVEKSHEINPQGNIPVTFHSSAMLPGQITEKGKEAEETLAINEETGSISRIPLKERKFPGEEGKPNVEKELNIINKNQWKENIRSLVYYANQGERALRDSEILAKTAAVEKKAGKELTPEEKEAESHFHMGTTFLNDSYRNLKTLFETASTQCTTEKERRVLNDFANEIKPKIEEIKKAEKEKDIFKSVRLRKEILEDGVDVLDSVSPQIFKPLNDFAKEKTIQTFANVAFDSYKKFKDKAPIISIENPPIGGAFATGEELKDVVEKAREKFIEQATQEGMSKNQAKEAAEKVLGVTWDVGHINMLRKYGYEDKDIIKETEAVAPLVKHVHLSDNFGFEHTELPMGMGNVPLKEILDKLGKEGFNAKKIIEAGNWWQHFKTPPVKETLQAVGSPIYSMDMAPYWNQSLGLQQGYMGGLEGQWLPQINYETFGGGFSQLPTELGGQRPGAQGSRMSGTPME